MWVCNTKNLSLPKGQARKLVLKFIGPYKLLRDFRNNSFELDLPPHLRQRGIHPVFHSSLLRAHIPNDDRLFPGRLETQVADFGEDEPEWSVLQTHINFPRFLTIFPDFLERLSHLAPIY
jgi:hypothetical protein